MRLKRRKRIRGINKRTIIYISLIAMLNVAGISYAVWSQDLVLDATYSTGSIDTIFECYTEDGSEVPIDGDVIDISRTVNSSNGLYSKTLTFRVINDGTVSSECESITGNSTDNSVNISSINVNDVVNPGGTLVGYIDIDIDTGTTTPGAYQFDVNHVLTFKNR